MVWWRRNFIIEHRESQLGEFSVDMTGMSWAMRGGEEREENQVKLLGGQRYKNSREPKYLDYI